MTKLLDRIGQAAPWEITIGPSTDDLAVCGAGAGDIIAEIVTGEIEHARLIAAAPELLEALKIMVSAVNVKEIDPLIMFVSVERARQAIAAAKGDAHHVQT